MKKCERCECELIAGDTCCDVTQALCCNCIDEGWIPIAAQDALYESMKDNLLTNGGK